MYLEGDSLAFDASGTRVAASPPPVAPLALELAAEDPAPAVAWLGRPCQLVTPADAVACEPGLWSDRRFSEPVVAALDRGLDALRAEAGADRLELIGYSGGGVLAALLAARRDDVVRLVTLSAPLALQAWRRLHALGPVDAADPARLAAPRLDATPQLHLAGARDAVVPEQILERYREARPEATRLLVERVDVDHGGWRPGWPERIAEIRRRLDPALAR